jgi:hypothetical protein
LETKTVISRLGLANGGYDQLAGAIRAGFFAFARWMFPYAIPRAALEFVRLGLSQGENNERQALKSIARAPREDSRRFVKALTPPIPVNAISG